MHLNKSPYIVYVSTHTNKNLQICGYFDITQYRFLFFVCQKWDKSLQFNNYIANSEYVKKNCAQTAIHNKVSKYNE